MKDRNQSEPEIALFGLGASRLVRHWLSGSYPMHHVQGVTEIVGAWVVQIIERKCAEQALVQSDKRKDEFLPTLA